MKRLQTFFLLFLFALTLQGQKVIMYQGDVSLMNAGKGTFDSGTESWGVYGTNTIENDNGALKITYVDNALGAYEIVSEVSDLSTDLTIERTYKVKVKIKVNSGSSIVWRLVSGGPIDGLTITNTDYEWKEMIFVSPAVTILIRMQHMDAGEIIWIDEWSIQEWYPDGRVIRVGNIIIRQD